MAAGEAVDLGERVIDGLRVEAAAALEERLFVAEVADMREPRVTTIEPGTR